MSRHTKNLEYVFRDFEAKIELDTDKLTIINWQNKDGGTDHNIRFMVDEKKLITTGDLGSNVFVWHGEGKLHMEWLNTISVGYLFGNREAKSTVENLWDSEICKKEALIAIENYHEDEPEKIPNALEKFKEATQYSDCFERQDSWAGWLNHDNRGEEHFGEDHWEFSYNLGVDGDVYRHEAIMYAIKQINEQLYKAEIVIPSALENEDSSEIIENKPSR